MTSLSRNALYVERLLWLTALAVISVVLFVIAESHVYQANLNSEFEHALAVTPPERAAPSSALSASVAYLGRLEIPRLDMSIMVLEGVDDTTLRHGIGHIPGTAGLGEAGNTGLAGHRDTFFRKLDGVRESDRITIRTLDGQYQYAVDTIRIVDPEMVEVLSNSGHASLTLVTCYPFHFIGSAPKRFVVQASLMEP